jgi:hypothetical protein
MAKSDGRHISFRWREDVEKIGIMTEKEAKDFVLSIYPEAHAIFYRGSKQVAIVNDNNESSRLSIIKYYESWAWVDAAEQIQRKMLEKFES